MIPNRGKRSYCTSLFFLNPHLGLDDHAADGDCFLLAPVLKLHIFFLTIFVRILPFYRILENSKITFTLYTVYT